jgi:hypothetical protein
MIEVLQRAGLHTSKSTADERSCTYFPFAGPNWARRARCLKSGTGYDRAGSRFVTAVEILALSGPVVRSLIVSKQLTTSIVSQSDGLFSPSE